MFSSLCAFLIRIRSDEDKVVAVSDADRGTVYFNCSARSIQTLVYQ